MKICHVDGFQVIVPRQQNFQVDKRRPKDSQNQIHDYEWCYQSLHDRKEMGKGMPNSPETTASTKAVDGSNNDPLEKVYSSQRTSWGISAAFSTLCATCSTLWSIHHNYCLQRHPLLGTYIHKGEAQQNGEIYYAEGEVTGHDKTNHRTYSSLASFCISI